MKEQEQEVKNTGKEISPFQRDLRKVEPPEGVRVRIYPYPKYPVPPKSEKK